jgi:hypothetical protein
VTWNAVSDGGGVPSDDYHVPIPFNGNNAMHYISDADTLTDATALFDGNLSTSIVVNSSRGAATGGIVIALSNPSGHLWGTADPHYISGIRIQTTDGFHVSSGDVMFYLSFPQSDFTSNGILDWRVDWNYYLLTTLNFEDIVIPDTSQSDIFIDLIHDIPGVGTNLPMLTAQHTGSLYFWITGANLQATIKEIQFYYDNVNVDENH